MLLLAAAWQWTPLAQWTNLEPLADMVENIRGNSLAPFIIIGVFVLGGFILFPVTLIIAATAIAFGPINGFLYSLAGCLLSAMATYTVGRVLGRQGIRQLTGSWVNRLSLKAATHGVLSVAILHILPIAPYTVKNMVAGSSHISFKDFVFGTILGMVPGITVITLLEYQIEMVMYEQEAENFVILAILFVLFIGGGVALYRKLGITSEGSKKGPMDT
jgi:uncharacterized membrane protein YdjX (TVP38/TMEM64 family)